MIQKKSPDFASFPENLIHKLRYEKKVDLLWKWAWIWPVAEEKDRDIVL